MTRARDLADGKFATDVEVENSTAGAQNMLVIHHASNTSGDESKIQFKRTTDAGSDREVAAIVADRIGGNDTDLAFETNTDGADGAVEKMRLSHLGILSVDQVFGLSDTDTGIALGANGADIMQFYTGNSERVRIQAAGGISFNGDTATANALDDYEEGTWTAQMLGSSTNPSNTVLATTANYTKIGSLVWAGATFVGVNTTGASGAVAISGMPFDSNFTVPMGNVMSQNTFNVGSTVANITPFWANSTQVWFYHTLHGSNIWGSVQHSAGTSRYLYLSLIYTTNS